MDLKLIILCNVVVTLLAGLNRRSSDFSLKAIYVVPS